MVQKIQAALTTDPERKTSVAAEERYDLVLSLSSGSTKLLESDPQPRYSLMIIPRLVQDDEWTSLPICLGGMPLSVRPRHLGRSEELSVEILRKEGLAFSELVKTLSPRSGSHELGPSSTAIIVSRGACEIAKVGELVAAIARVRLPDSSSHALTDTRLLDGSPRELAL